MAISARLVRDAIIRISALINVLVGTDFNLIISWPETGLCEVQTNAPKLSTTRTGSFRLGLCARSVLNLVPETRLQTRAWRVRLLPWCEEGNSYTIPGGFH